MEYKTEDMFSRTAMLLGKEAEFILSEKHVVVFGLGGVGGHCAEALARCGVGHMTVVDSDTISISNLNRQIVSTKNNIGNFKATEMANRIESISNCDVSAHNIFIRKDMIGELIPENTDFLIDAVDNVSVKIAAAEYANSINLDMISSMGMGNRLNPTMVRIGDLFSITGCPLARVMRRELRKRNIKTLATAYSLELPIKPRYSVSEKHTKPVPASSPFVPAAAGLAMAHYAIMAMLQQHMN